MRILVGMIVLGAIAIAGTNSIEAAESDSGRVGYEDGRLSAQRAPAEGDTPNGGSLGAPVTGTGGGSAEAADLGQAGCTDEIGAAASGTSTSNTGDGTSAGEALGEVLRATRAAGCDPGSSSVGGAVAEGLRNAGQTISGDQESPVSGAVQEGARRIPENLRQRDR